MANNFLLSSLALCLCVAACQPTPPKTIGEVLQNDWFPIFGADSYHESSRTIGKKVANGRVYANVTLYSSLEQILKRPQKYLIIADDTLVREMIAADLQQQALNPERQTIPVFFMRHEEFRILEMDKTRLKGTENVKLQNIKVIRSTD